MIVKRGNVYEVRSEDGKRLLGTYKTRAAALNRLRQIEFFKRKKR